MTSKYRLQPGLQTQPFAITDNGFEITDTILHICHVEKSEIPLHLSDFSPFAMERNLKFLHMTDFSPHVSHVNYVTNMRYV